MEVVLREAKKRHAASSPGPEVELPTVGAEHWNEALNSLDLRAGVVGADADAEKLGLPKIEDSYGIYDPDFLPDLC
jgi:hypothetical protein